jgi:hypothetical protein
MVSAIERQILQSNVIERIQQVQQQHPDLQQQYFEVHLNKERRKMTKKINGSEEIYHIDIDEERKNQQKDHQKKHGTTDSDGDGEASSEQEQHCHIDVKV